MKTLKVIIGIICMLVVCSICQAQELSKRKSVIIGEPLKESDFSQPSTVQHSGGLSGEMSLKGTPGSPYLFDEWLDGTIIMKDKNPVKGKKYRYNLYTQQMQFIEGNDTVAIANPEDIEQISFGGKTFIFTSYDAPEKTGKGYFELISEGNCRILKKWVVLYHVVDEQEAGQMSSSADKSEFLRDCNCYLQFGETPAMKASHNKKELLPCFKEDQDKVEAFMKQNNIKMKTENDLKAVVDYYNKIQE
jgi:hypothetical protein